MNLGYIARETGKNLVRNLSITIASILTVAVSLGLVGASFLLRLAVENATERWQGGIEFVIFMNPEASTDEIEAVRDDLQSSPGVESLQFVDQEGAYEEFKRLFADEPEMVQTVRKEDLPVSFRVVPVDKEAASVESLAQQFTTRPGVRDVVLASETIEFVQDLVGAISTSVIWVAAILLGGSTLLILNTIRMAVFARRREIEVMKLVGATNSFIRIPFMLEGFLQGVIGAGLAILGLSFGRPLFGQLADLPEADTIPLVSGFVVNSSEALLVYSGILAGGCIVGALAAAIAVTGYLDV